jgi:hypothetical protein
VSADVAVADRLRILPGLRLNLDHYGGRVAPTVDPKLALRWEAVDSLTFKIMAAVAHQPPAVYQVAPPFGDPSIPPVMGQQYSAGLEWRPTDEWFVSVEGFLQTLDKLVRPSDALSSDDGELERVYWSDDLEGRAYGLEVLIRKSYGGRFHGWLSYSLMRAERLRPPRGWTLDELDQTHVLNLAWTFRLGAGWSLGTRFQLATGNPYYPVVDARYDADRDRYVARYADKPSRLRAYHRLDLRIDKTWRFDDWMFELYLDIQNVYNATNPEALEYSYDFVDRTTGASLPILPTLGIRVVL